MVIGYSFPQYNRITDRKIIDAFKENSPLYLHYQDPTESIEQISNFINFNFIDHSKSTYEFFAPDEFINPQEPEVFSF